MYGLCIEGPCGQINENAFNISILVPDNSSVENVVLTVNQESENISLAGLDADRGQVRSCWFATALRPTPSLVSSVSYTLDGEPRQAAIEGSTIMTDAMIIEISRNQVMYYDHVADCQDTPNG